MLVVALMTSDFCALSMYPFMRCRMCSCCCSKGGHDVEVASDDEKGRMLAKDNQDHQNNAINDDPANVPLQSKQEEEM